MDRRIVYSGAIPLDLDVLLPQRNALIALGMFASALFGLSATDESYGTEMWYDGLECVPNGGMTVRVLPGQIYAHAPIDQTNYGSLAAMTGNFIMKQGLLLESQGFSCPAPTQAGQYIAYLVQATYTDLDYDSQIVQYFNPDNPDTPLNGPGGDSSYQNTNRKGICNLSLKASAAAPINSLVYPAPDSGNIPLYYVLVAYGQTAIVPTNITLTETDHRVVKALYKKLSQIDGTKNNFDASTVRGLTPEEIASGWRGVVVYADQAGQTTVQQASTTQIVWGAKTNPVASIDTSNFFDAAHSNKIVIPAGVSKIKASCHVALNGYNSGGQVTLVFNSMNGGISRSYGASLLSGAQEVEASTAVLSVTPGDEILVNVTLSSGSGTASIAPNSYFMIEAVA